MEYLAGIQRNFDWPITYKGTRHSYSDRLYKIKHGMMGTFCYIHVLLQDLETNLLRQANLAGQPALKLTAQAGATGHESPPGAGLSAAAIGSACALGDLLDRQWESIKRQVYEDAGDSLLKVMVSDSHRERVERIWGTLQGLRDELQGSLKGAQELRPGLVQEFGCAVERFSKAVDEQLLALM